MTTVRLDDRNPAIYYTGGTWNLGGVSQEYNSTTTWFNGTGGIVSLEFSGISIAVWGTIGNTADGANPHTSYVVDGGAPFVFGATQDSDIHYQQTFFLSEPLNLTSHTLIIETLSPAAAYYLDFIEIGLPSADQTTTVTVVATAPANGLPTSSTLSTGNSASTDTTTPSTSANTSPADHPVPVGAIIGGSLGGAVLVICVFFVWQFWVLQRRRARLERSRLNDAVLRSSSAQMRYSRNLIIPFPLPVPETSAPGYTSDSVGTSNNPQSTRSTIYTSGKVPGRAIT